MPEFEGKLDPNEFIEWLQTVERIFDFKEIPEDNKVKIVALRLRKYAPYGGQTLMLRELEKGRVRLLLGTMM